MLPIALKAVQLQLQAMGANRYELGVRVPPEKSDDGKPNPFRGMAAWAVPYAVGDSYQGRRIVATTPQLFGVDDAGTPLPADRVPHYRATDAYTFAQGRAFAPNKFEAVIGSEVAQTEIAAGIEVG